MKRYLLYIWDEPRAGYGNAPPGGTVMGFVTSLDKPSDVLTVWPYVDGKLDIPKNLWDTDCELLFIDTHTGAHERVDVERDMRIKTSDLAAIDPPADAPAPIRRYMLFGMDKYTASGGMHDFLRSFDSPRECVNALQTWLTSGAEGRKALAGLTGVNRMFLYDQFTDREHEVVWRDYDDNSYHNEYRDFLHFDDLSKPR